VLIIFHVKSPTDLFLNIQIILLLLFLSTVNKIVEIFILSFFVNMFKKVLKSKSIQKHLILNPIFSLKLLKINYRYVLKKKKNIFFIIYIHFIPFIVNTLLYSEYPVIVNGFYCTDPFTITEMKCTYILLRNLKFFRMLLDIYFLRKSN
jgi:hypothetical protein